MDGEVDQSECYIDAMFASAKGGGEQILHLEAKPENLIGDRAYDSDPPDEQLRSQGVEFIAPHKSNRVKRKTQYGRRLRRYERRWIIERFFAWIQWKRRLLVRWEYYPRNFPGFVRLAALVILLKQF